MGDDSVRDWFRANLMAADAEAPAADAPAQVGALPLADFQRRAVARGAQIARTFGGVLLADAVGLGKTRVALAIAAILRRDARLSRAKRAANPDGPPSGSAPILCCVPARLESAWRAAAAQANLTDLHFLTHTQLSRADPNELARTFSPSVILVDEAHQFRNPKTRRHQRLAELASRASLVLVSATPVCNSRWDLYHLFRLFLGDQDLRRAVGHNLREAFTLADAGSWDLSELVELLVIRRHDAPDTRGFGRRPDLRLEVLTYTPTPAERWLWQHLERALNQCSMTLFLADWPRHLLTEFVLRRWESSPDALFATLAEMVDFHRRWLDAHAHNRRLGRHDFRRLFDTEIQAISQWRAHSGDAARQAVFPFFYPDSAVANAPDIPRAQVETDLARLQALLARVAQVLCESGTGNAEIGGKQRAMVDLIRKNRQNAQKTLVFCSFEHSARGFYHSLTRVLGPRVRVGLVTGRQAEATGLGRTSAHEIVRRFAPRSNGELRLPAHSQLEVLVCTDCMAEGVNLQDCAHVILADLPYSALRVEQRIGRLLRPGGPSDFATVYLPRPAGWADSLGLRRRLDKKAHEAAASGTVLRSVSQLSDTSRTDALRADAPRADAPQKCAPQPPDNPLAALTRRDALAEALGREQPANSALSTGFWRARTARGPARLWLRVRAHDAKHPRDFWCLTRAKHPATLRLSALIDPLIRDADERAALWRIPELELSESSESDESEENVVQFRDLLQVATDCVKAREALLRAARLAPFPMRLDAPQRLVWQKICAAAARHEISAPPETLQSLGNDLLRSFPRGIERNLAALARSDLSAPRLLARTRALIGEVPRWQPDVRLQVVSGLLLLPAPARRAAHSTSFH